MLYSVISSILRRHAPFHLLVPLLIGVGIEALYANAYEHVLWRSMPGELLSRQRIALYVGIVLAYIVVIGLQAKSETMVGLKNGELNTLTKNLATTTRLFAVSTTPL